MQHLCDKRQYKKSKERVFVSGDVHEFEDECMNKKKYQNSLSTMNFLPKELGNALISPITPPALPATRHVHKSQIQNHVS